MVGRLYVVITNIYSQIATYSLYFLINMYIFMPKLLYEWVLGRYEKQKVSKNSFYVSPRASSVLDRTYHLHQYINIYLIEHVIRITRSI